MEKWEIELRVALDSIMAWISLMFSRAPTKLVPLSEYMWAGTPRLAVDRLRVAIKSSVERDAHRSKGSLGGPTHKYDNVTFYKDRFPGVPSAEHKRSGKVHSCNGEWWRGCGPSGR